LTLCVHIPIWLFFLLGVRMRPREFLPRDVFDLREPVGEGRPNRPDDVATVERLLDRVGQPPFGTSREPTGLFSAPLRDSIRRFQRRNGLRDDGAVKPDGETFGTLAREIGFDDRETGRASTFVDPDGTTRRGRRCGRIAARLGNLSLDLKASRRRSRAPSRVSGKPSTGSTEPPRRRRDSPPRSSPLWRALRGCSPQEIHFSRRQRPVFLLLASSVPRPTSTWSPVR